MNEIGAVVVQTKQNEESVNAKVCVTRRRRIRGAPRPDGASSVLQRGAVRAPIRTAFRTDLCRADIGANTRHGSGGKAKPRRVRARGRIATSATMCMAGMRLSAASFAGGRHRAGGPAP